MIKKLYILLFASLLSVPSMAQGDGGGDKSMNFAPKKGEWQFSLMLGKNTFFEQSNGMNYLLPEYRSTSVGLPGGGDQFENESGALGMYLNLNGMEGNSITNIVGVETKYFINENMSINLTFNMSSSLTPKKDYVEGDLTVPSLPIASYKYMEGNATNAWAANLGYDYYFKTKNDRLRPYLGVVGGFRMARIETMLPYTGEKIFDNTLDQEVPLENYVSSNRAGEIWGIQGGIVAGIDYCIAKGLIIGIALKPVVYNYSVVNIAPPGSSNFTADNHNIQVFNSPMLKLGFRF